MKEVNAVFPQFARAFARYINNSGSPISGLRLDPTDKTHQRVIPFVIAASGIFETYHQADDRFFRARNAVFFTNGVLIVDVEK